MKQTLNALLIGFLTLSLFTTGSCTKKDAAADPPVSNSTDAGATVEALPPFVPQPADVLKPYTGIWQNSGLQVAFLIDGRVVITNQHSSSIPLEIGTYHVNTDKTIDFQWMFSGHEHTHASLQNSNLELSIYELQKTGDADDAIALYNQQYQQLVNESNTFNARFAIGAAVKGAGNANDPNANNVFANAVTYSGAGVHFADSFSGTQWYEMPDHSINVYDSYSRADLWFLPNGRFVSEMWLWKGVDIHDYAHVKHYISWGKYAVTPGINALEGDLVKVEYDNGRTATYNAVGGRRYCQTKYIIYHNWALK
jgi:hypothetical protein